MSTPTAAPPSWLEAAAKLDALLGDKVPLPGKVDVEPDEEVEDREGEAPAEPRPQTARQEPRPPEVKPRPRITPPILPVSENGEEVDVAWRGWSPLAVVPSTIGLAAVTALALLVVRPLIPARVGPVAVEGPLAAVWLLQLVRGVYRLMAYNYRLTTRRLFRERGRLYRPEPPIDLSTVIAVETAQNRIERWLGIGTVLVVPEDATPQVPGIEFIGIRRPKALADLIDAAAKAAHEGNVAATRIPGEADVRS